MAPIRISGMNSGLDTESIVKAMVSGYESKKQKVEGSKTKLEWKQDIWKDVNSKVYSLYTGLDKVRFSSNFKSRKTSVSDPSKATVTAKDGATNGTQKLRVTQLATTGYLTGGKIKTANGNSVDSSTTMSDLGIKEGSTIDVTAGGRKTAITMDKDMTVKDFVTKLQGTGINASYDAENGRFFISAKSSGKSNDFKLEGRDEDGINALKALGLFSTTDAEIAERRSIADYGLYKSDGTVDEAQTAQKAKNEFTALQARYSAALSDKTDLVSQRSDLQTQKDESDAGVATSKSIVDYLTDKKLVEEKKASGMTQDELDADEEYTAALARVTEMEDRVAGGEETDPDIVSQVNAAMAAVDGEGNADIGALTDLLDTNTAVLTGYQDTSAALQTQIGTLNSQIADAQSVMDGVTSEIRRSKLFSEFSSGIESLNPDDVANAVVGKVKTASEELKSEKTDGATRIFGQDAEIYLNGAQFTSNTNSFSINGFDITANALTGDDELTITTTTDVDGIYDKFKEFLSQFNDVVNELQSLYNAESAKGYEPLTEDQKDEMNEKEIEKWETKIKDSLLRRDSTLGSVISAMSVAMSSSFNVTLSDGSKTAMSLAGVGVHTLGFLNAKTNEQYAYHIDGDEDDSSVSGKADKLRTFIESDPDAAADLLSQAAQSLYKALDEKIGMKTSETSSAFTLYNDKQMKRDLETYTKSISKWEDRVTEQEDYYYKKFTAMEKALANLNSSQTSLSGMLGG